MSGSVDPMQRFYDMHPDALADEARRLELELAELDRWASSMPDAGFNDQSPRWDWWHRKPRSKVRRRPEFTWDDDLECWAPKSEFGI